MVSIYLGQDPDTLTYMEVLSDREDCHCEVFQTATGSDLVLRERVSSRNERTSIR